MKKVYLFILFACMALTSATAQYYYNPYTHVTGNPKGLNGDAEYPIGGGMEAGWTHLYNASSATPTWSSIGTLPFAFNFNGGPVTTFKASNTGILTFSTTAVNVPPATNSTLPSASIPDSSICVWGMVGTGVQGYNSTISTKTFGTAPNRLHYVSYTFFTAKESSACWTNWSVVFEETTNRFYIVDQRESTQCNSALTLGVQINSTTATMVSGSPSITSKSNGGGAGADDNIYYQFILGTQPAVDASAYKSTVKKYSKLSEAPFPLGGQLINFGSDAITSMDLNYSINGGTPVTANVTGLNIASKATYEFNHPTSWTPSSIGDYTVELWASNINGQVDGDLVNDKVSSSTSVLSNFITRLPLHEVFTSATCPPCNPANINLKDIEDANLDKLTMIKYQMNYPSPGNDPYYTSESASRHTFYGINSIPRVEVDGGWDDNGNSYTQSILDEYLSVPSFVELTSTYSMAADSTFKIDVKVDPIKDISSSKLKLFIAIMEGTTFENKRTNGETEFFHVMKKMVPNANGTTVASLVNGTAQNISKTYKFPEDHTVEEFDDLEVLVFLQDNTTKEVFQSAYSTKVDAPVGINNSSRDDKNGIISVGPNPAVNNFNLKYTLETAENTSVELYNVLGELVYAENLGSVAPGKHAVSVPTESLSTGIYITKLTIGNKTYSKKVNVMR